MGYFKEVPNLEYQSFLKGKLSSQDYLTVKNFFRRVKLREDLESVYTFFSKYTIIDGLRPDNVAEDLYDSPQLDWVVLISAGIVNVKMNTISNSELLKHSERKYGTELSGVRHYETTQVVDNRKRLILPAGLVVDSTFTIPDPSNPLETLNPVVPITNFEYEVRKNDKKRNISVLRNDYLDKFLLDTRRLMRYTRSSEYINNSLIKTENTESKLP